MKIDPLALRYPCPRCAKVFGTENGKRIHLTLVHKGEIHDEVMAHRSERESRLAAIAPLNLLRAPRTTLEALETALDEVLESKSLLHVHEQAIIPVLVALRHRLGIENSDSESTTKEKS